MEGPAHRQNLIIFYFFSLCITIAPVFCLLLQQRKKNQSLNVRRALIVQCLWNVNIMAALGTQCCRHFTASPRLHTHTNTLPSIEINKQKLRQVFCFFFFFSSFQTNRAKASSTATHCMLKESTWIMNNFSLGADCLNWNNGQRKMCWPKWKENKTERQQTESWNCVSCRFLVCVCNVNN